MRGVLFDQPHVVDGRGRVGERCEVVGGSFFDAVPEGADAYVLKAVLHDWEDDDAVAHPAPLPRRDRPTDGALLVVERDLGAPNENADAKLSDLNMLVGAGRARAHARRVRRAVRRGRLRAAEHDAQRDRAERVRGPSGLTGPTRHQARRCRAVGRPRSAVG